MTKLFPFSILFIVVMFLSSCNDKIDLVGDHTETAVIYGLLDRSNTEHFIKINRAFIGPGNSLEIAQIPDSSYFEQVNATISEVVNGNVTRVWNLKDTLVNNKETNGVFYAPTQKLYYFKTSTLQPLIANANTVYKFRASINGGRLVVEGQTGLISDMSTSADPQNFRFDFADNPGSYTQKGISVQVANSSLVNTSLRVNFEEIVASSSDTTIKSFLWNLGELETTPNATKTFTVNGETFYNLVKSNVTNNPLITKRRIKSIEVVTTGGAEDLYNYILVNQPSSSLAQTKPTFTNLTVNAPYRVIGVFSSRYTDRVEKNYINTSNGSLRMMSANSVIELCTGAITGNLLFCSQHIGDSGTSYSCQ